IFGSGFRYCTTVSGAGVRSKAAWHATWVPQGLPTGDMARKCWPSAGALRWLPAFPWDVESAALLPSAQEAFDAGDGFLQAVQACGVRKTHGIGRVRRTEVAARYSSHAGFVQQPVRKIITVQAVLANVRINIERAIRRNGHVQAEAFEFR